MKHNADYSVMPLLLYDNAYPQVWMAERDMKRLVCFIALLLLAFHSSYSNDIEVRDTTGIAETICITNEFAVDIEYPNFLVSILAHIAGINTDSLKFVEWDIRAPSLHSFLIHLTDDNERRWLEIASDSSYPSFVKLPLEKRTVLVPNTINFFGKALQFLRNMGADTLYATFAYGQDTLGASMVHLSRCTDTVSVITTISHIQMWNKKTGKVYYSAEVTAVTHEGYTTFRNIKIYLKKKGIILRLTSVHITVKSSKY
ncbi:MAG: hypothetical protein ABSA44_07595 [Bacteroidota bacterium]|jgi:hypothetical protein